MEFMASATETCSVMYAASAREAEDMMSGQWGWWVHSSGIEVGDLFGTENAGDCDDSEELNWIREGRHYGFPWRIGTSVTPQQFPGYDPSADPFVQ
ncbi:MAG: hypothetical protein ACI9BV_003589, partial [Rhodothermales bacterium]